MAPRGWGFWTEAKLDILSAYLSAFAVAGSKKASGALVYIDLFAGNTSNQRRDVERDIKGSSLRALESLPDYARIYLFELERVAAELEADLRRLHPGRQFIVVPGDCNATLPAILAQLKSQGVAWAPTFAFIDPYSSAALRWATIQRLADFKRDRKYKVEQWLLFYGSDIPRVRGQNPTNAEALLRQTSGGDVWVPIAEGRERGDLSAEEARREYTNLLRWRLENTLGYRYTHSFEVRNTSGSYLYDLVFATDNDAGNKIMGDVYAAAAQRFEQMRVEAYERRRADRTGQDTLFGPEAMSSITAGAAEPYRADPPSLPYGFDGDANDMRGLDDSMDEHS
ncbi:MAG: three-Cys-motif partner protein TcmP [Acidimicrobiales bacterium]